MKTASKLDDAVASPSKWHRHQIARRVRPTGSIASTTTGTRASTRASSVRSARDAALHMDGMAQHRKRQRQGRDKRQWHQSRVFFAVLAVVLALCFGWTLWLVLLTMAPNEAINYVMRTKELDNGSFWLLVKPTPMLRTLGVIGLSAVALGYLYVGAMLVAWGRQRTSALTAVSTLATIAPGRPVSVLSPASNTTDLERELRPRGIGGPGRSSQSFQKTETPVPTSQRRRSWHEFYAELLREDSATRKLAHVWLKVADVLLQQFVLYQTLEVGFPMPLVTTCTVMVVLNALAVPALMYSPVPPSQLIEALVDSTSDLLVAVGFPVIVLGYCLATFEYDRESMRLTAEIFKPWSFQCAARVQANPLQTAIVYKSLEGLRLQSVTVCLARVGNNFALLFGLYRLMALLRRPQLPAAAPGPSCEYQRTANTNIYPRKHPLAGLFVALALGTVIFVTQSVRHSQQACASQPLCVMHAHRWWLSRASSGDFSSSSSSDPVPSGAYNCPCRVLIDVDLAPSTYSAWSDPPYATAAVAELAVSGDLEILQLVNRRLPELPEMLRHCTLLKHLALVFTHTTVLPSWAADFTELQFLHIEGKSESLSLTTLPQELFASMTQLTFVHLGVHPTLRELPAFGGLTNLRSVTLVGMDKIRQLPSDLTELHSLEMFLLTGPLVETIPDLSGMKESLKVLVISPSALCCNGFRGNDCDLSSAVCGTQSNSIGELLECLPTQRQATSGTLEVFTTFKTTVCVNHNPFPAPMQRANGSESASADGSNETVAEDSEAILERSILQCAGVQYRECKLEGTGSSRLGMCLSERFTPISCSGNLDAIELRRRQISAHVGPSCNPDYEDWLGCTAS